MLNSEVKNPVDLDLKEWDIVHCSIREILGLRYYEETQPIRDCINKIAEDCQCGPLKAGCVLLECMKEDPGYGGYSMMLAMAVTFELYTESALNPDIEDLGLVPAEGL